MNLNTLLVKLFGQTVLGKNFSVIVKLLNTHMFVAYSASLGGGKKTYQSYPIFLFSLN